MRVTGEIFHESDLGRWRLVLAAPGPALAGLVAGYQGYDEAAPAPVVRRETPQPVYPVIIAFRGGFRLAEQDGPWRLLPAAFAAGLYTRSVRVASEGAIECLQIDLTPFGARRLFRLDLDALAGRTHNLAELLPGAAALAERLEGLRDWPARLAALEGFLVERLAAGATDRRAAHAWRRLVRSHGRLPVAHLAAELEMSRQTLATLFAREVGLSPKAAARILRLDHAIGLIGRPLPLAEVALEAGYADQAHMGREVQAMTGETPRGLRARILPDGTGLLAPA